jgi:formate dehydrogenase maturation protein FdhE
MGAVGASGHVEAGDRVARVDTCAACHGYIKTVDLRAPGTKEVVPLVDDVATLPLDLWAQDRGVHARHSVVRRCVRRTRVDGQARLPTGR